MDIVKKMWAAHCEAADGVTYDGKPLPTWEELGEGRQKCWVAAGKEAADEIERLREALRLIAAPSKIIAKSEDMAVMLQLLLTSHRQTALKALGEDHD